MPQTRLRLQQILYRRSHMKFAEIIQSYLFGKIEKVPWQERVDP
jgi:hypothetical protein